MKRNLPLVSLLLVTIALVLAAGCSTALKSDKIVSIKQRCFGLVVDTANTANGTPSVKLGFTSTVIQIIPTSTNGPVNAPQWVDTFDMNQGLNPFATAITENSGAGGVMIGTNGYARAIVPK